MFQSASNTINLLGLLYNYYYYIGRQLSFASEFQYLFDCCRWSYETATLLWRSTVADRSTEPSQLQQQEDDEDDAEAIVDGWVRTDDVKRYDQSLLAASDGLVVLNCLQRHAKIHTPAL